jgi:hypothetical protein
MLSTDTLPELEQLSDFDSAIHCVPQLFVQRLSATASINGQLWKRGFISNQERDASL